MCLPDMPILTIDMQSYWISGSGRGQGFAVDEETLVDGDGFPFLPGRHVKGVLLEGVHRLCEVRQDLPDRLPAWLFGAEGRQSADPGSPGRALLLVRDARLSPGLRHELAREPHLRDGLFRTIASTAMEPDIGVARSKSLRTLRVAVPLTLYADVSLDADRSCGVPEEIAAHLGSWPDILQQALAFAPAFGGGRNRGFGRCLASLAT